MAQNAMKTCLLVIDMQNGFKPSKDPQTRKNCIAQVKRAMAKRMPIFIVEYTPKQTGKTSRYITRVLDNYDNVHYITKYKDDGGEKIMDYVKKHNLDIKHFIVCGVNISFCVAETVKSLIRLYRKKVLIIKDDCNCHYDREKAFDGCYGNINTEVVYTDDFVTLV